MGHDTAGVKTCMRQSERFFRLELGHRNKVNVISFLLFILLRLFIEKVT